MTTVRARLALAKARYPQGSTDSAVIQTPVRVGRDVLECLRSGVEISPVVQQGIRANPLIDTLGAVRASLEANAEQQRALADAQRAMAEQQRAIADDQKAASTADAERVAAALEKVAAAQRAPRKRRLERDAEGQIIGVVDYVKE